MKKLRLWVRGLVGAIIGGGATALSTAVTDPALLATTEGRATIATTAALPAIISAALYLKQHPLP